MGESLETSGDGVGTSVLTHSKTELYRSHHTIFKYLYLANTKSTRSNDTRFHAVYRTINKRVSRTRARVCTYVCVFACTCVYMCVRCVFFVYVQKELWYL